MFTEAKVVAGGIERRYVFAKKWQFRSKVVFLILIISIKCPIEVAWEYAKLIIKAFGKVGWRIKTNNAGYLICFIFSGAE